MSVITVIIHQNILLDTKIIALCVVVTKIWKFFIFHSYDGSHLEFLELLEHKY